MGLFNCFTPTRRVGISHQSSIDSDSSCTFTSEGRCCTDGDKTHNLGAQQQLGGAWTVKHSERDQEWPAAEPSAATAVAGPVPALARSPETDAGPPLDRDTLTSPGSSAKYDVLLSDREVLKGHPRYVFRRHLKRGTQGFLQHAVDLHTKEEVAIKFVPRGPDIGAGGQLERGLLNHAALTGHTHIIALRQLFLTPRYLAIVTDFADGGDLAEALSRQVFQTGKGMGESDARPLFQQLATAVDFAHRRGICSRDIKLDNVLLHGDAPQLVKLCDFGFSIDCDFNNETCLGEQLCGTPEYMAPEMVRGDAVTGPHLDVFGLGVVLYMLVAGRFPFLHPAEEALPREQRLRAMRPRILSGQFAPFRQESVQLQHLLRRMLQTHAKHRATMAEVLKHPWVKKDLPKELAALNGRLACGKLPAGSTTFGGSGGTVEAAGGRKGRRKGGGSGSSRIDITSSSGGGSRCPTAVLRRQSDAEISALVHVAQTDMSGTCSPSDCGGNCGGGSRLGHLASVDEIEELLSQAGLTPRGMEALTPR